MATDRTGVITRGVGGLYCVRFRDEEEKEYLCRARGIFRLENITPTVGDRVVIEPADNVQDDCLKDPETPGEKGKSDKGADVDWVISEIKERDNILIRPPLANLDYLFAVVPAASPEPDLLTLDKLTVISENASIETVIVVNKCDLDRKKADEIEKIYSKAGFVTFTVSGETGEGIDKLSSFVSDISSRSDGRFVSGAFAGVSGAGKSTIMTSVFPNLNLKTGHVSYKNLRGRHTTRHVELFPVKVHDGVFWLADTPGFSMLDFARFDFFPYEELPYGFREFGDFIGKCRYRKCTHLKEEGCAVIDQVKNGTIPESRHQNYIKIFEEQRSIPQWKRKKESELW